MRFGCSNDWKKFWSGVRGWYDLLLDCNQCDVYENISMGVALL